MISEDHYGNLLMPGTQVAFNFQGQLRKGTIVDIRARQQYGRAKDYSGEPYLTIEVVHCDNNRQKSKVTNRKNVVAI